MDVPGCVWLRTIVRLVALLVFDFPLYSRIAHPDGEGGGDLVGAVRRAGIQRRVDAATTAVTRS